VAERAADRVKAADLRRKRHRTLEQQRWLDAYIARTALSKARALPAGTDASSAAASSSSSFAQSTVPQNDNMDPATHTWTPTIPKPADDAPPAPPGADAPPPPGSPVIDATAPTPTGDPAAAAQFAMIVALITKAGIKAVMELTDEKDLPEEIRGVMTDPVEQAEAVMFVAQAAHRIAIKYNFKQIPMSDEIVVGGAVAASAFAYFAVRKKRKKAIEQQAAPRVDEEKRDPSNLEDPKMAPPPVSGLWSS